MLNASPMIWSTAVSRSFRLSIIATAIASLGVLTACSSTPQKASVAKSSVADDELLDAGSVDSLENLLYASELLSKAGWIVKDGQSTYRSAAQLVYYAPAIS